MTALGKQFDRSDTFGMSSLIAKERTSLVSRRRNRRLELLSLPKCGRIGWE